MKTPLQPGRKGEPISLAEFIGGRATGPRLNKPAPQADAHDPTLFDQRTRADITTPHPIFGSGGIALVGLANKGRDAAVVEPSRDTTPVMSRTTSVSSAASRHVTQQSTVTPPFKNGSGNGQNIRGRVESLYGSGNASRSTENLNFSKSLRGSKSSEKIADRQPTIPAKPEGLRKPISISQESPRRISPSSSFSQTTPTTSPFSQVKPASTSPPVTIPSLARPLQPQPKPLPTGITPVIPLSKHPSPAFLKPAQQKDLTPSLSRLQGRGFVQSLVKLSGELEAASASSGGSIGGTPEKDRVVTPKKQTSVLDRWQPQQQQDLNSSPYSPPPLRKVRTFDSPTPPSQAANVSTVGIANAQPKRTPSPHKSSLPDSQSNAPAPMFAPKVKSTVYVDPSPSPSLPGLGSSNTLISYIKPTKTGDNPPTESPETTSQVKASNSDTGVDELGMRRRTESAPSAITKISSQPSSQLASLPPTGRRLNHVRFLR